MSLCPQEAHRFLADLFDRCQWAMYREAYRILDNPWDTEDVIQMVWLKLLDKVDLLRKRAPAQQVTYVLTACRNTALTYHQRNRLREETPWGDLLDLLPGEGDPQDLAWEPEEHYLALRHAWHQLDPRSQYLLRSRYLEHKSFSEIARHLGIQPTSVRMALTRAKRRARALILRELKQREQD